MDLKEIRRRFTNREISWLYFNDRVLQEAQDKNVPLIERFRFLGIFSNNLDEFYRVRIANINRLIKIQKTSKQKTVENPKVIFDGINKYIQSQQIKFENTFTAILEELKKENIFFLEEDQLSQEQGVIVQNYFNEKIRPSLVPLMINYLPEFPQLRDDAIYLAIKLYNSHNTNKLFSIIEIPTKTLNRFFVLPEENNKFYIILIDDIIRYCLDSIYSNSEYENKEAFTFKITRDAEFDLDHDYSQSFLEIMKSSIRQRKSGDPVRFVYDKNMPHDLLLYLRKKLKINKEDNLAPGIKYHNFKDFITFPSLNKKKLINEECNPLKVNYLESNKSVFKAIAKKDVLLYFPYQSFNYIIDFLREAAIDPKVTSIKTTLYRVANNSNIINALVSAARNGKKVTVVIELMARFDEKNNINWSKKLTSEGIKVVHGIPSYKVHSKLIQVERIENNKKKYYSNISTGNFNESTAKFYCDVSLLSYDAAINRDVSKVFELIENQDFTIQFEELLVSPRYFKVGFLEMVQNEIINAKAGKPSFIYLKLNNLVDRDVINCLYKASDAGVKIKIIVRGISSLKPQKVGLSENIEAISLVDKYLEHARFYLFCNNNKMKAFISSADLMTRNLDHRVEVTTPIKSASLKKEILYLFNDQWADNTKSRVIDDIEINKYKHNQSEKYRHQVGFYNYLKSKDMDAN